MLELAILGLLQEQAMHGYALQQQLNRKLGHIWRMSYGSLYPALRRLEKRGAIEKVFSDDDTNRKKNIYRITDLGHEEFLELIEDRASTQWEEEKFPLRFAFFRYVKPEIRLRLLERRRAYLEDKLEDLRASRQEAEQRADSYTLSLMDHGLDATAADIDWLDELIAAERRQIGETRGRDDVADAVRPVDPPVPTPDETTRTGGRTPARTRT